MGRKKVNCRSDGSCVKAEEAQFPTSPKWSSVQMSGEEVAAVIETAAEAMHMFLHPNPHASSPCHGSTEVQREPSYQTHLAGSRQQQEQGATIQCGSELLSEQNEVIWWRDNEYNRRNVRRQVMNYGGIMQGMVGAEAITGSHCPALSGTCGHVLENRSAREKMHGLDVSSHLGRVKECNGRRNYTRLFIKKRHSEVVAQRIEMNGKRRLARHPPWDR